jgi:hypothetical protein
MTRIMALVLHGVTYIVVALILAFLTAGCLSTAPEYVYCNGKGTMSVQGLYGGGIMVDCSATPNGMLFYTGKLPPTVVPVPPSTPLAPLPASLPTPR